MVFPKGRTMTILTTTRKAGPFPGNGATTSFPFSFKVFNKTDLVVILTDADGVDSELVLDSTYSVTLNDDQSNTPGGYVTYPLSGSPMPDGVSLAIDSAVPETQPANLQNMGGYYPKVIEDCLDRLTILIQQLGGDVDAALAVLAGAKAELQAFVEAMIAGITTPTFQSFEPALLVDGADYTSGTSNQVILPETTAPKTIAAVFFDGVFQSRSQWSLLPDDVTLQFVSVIPQGIAEINVVYFNPSLLGSFLQTGANAQLRTFQDKGRDTFAVKDFMVGVTADDDTTALESAINESLRTGRRIAFPHDRDLIITRPIYVRVPNAYPFPNPGGGIDLHFSRTRTLKIIGQGGWGIKAAPNFSGAQMMVLTYNSGTDTVAPQGTCLEDMTFDGAGIVDTGIMSDYCGRVALYKTRFSGLARGVQWIGYGGVNIDNCSFYTTTGIDFTAGGGDNWITKSDFFCVDNAILLGYLGANCTIWSNVFNRQDDEFPSDSRQRAVVFSGNQEIRNIRIHNNEFCGMEIPIVMTGTGSLNVKKVHIINNHMIPSAGGGAVWTGALAQLQQAQNCIIQGNQLGYMGLASQAAGTIPAIKLINGRDIAINHNHFSELQNAAIEATTVETADISNNIFRDVAKSSTSLPSIYLEGVTKSVVSCNSASRSSGSYGQTFLQEATGSTANKGVGNNVQGYSTGFALASGSTSTYS